MSDFATILTEVRTARGWTQKQLAEEAGLDQSYISRLEAGSRSPERSTAIKLADALALTPLERERLFAAGGVRSDISDEPMIRDLVMLLLDPSLPAATLHDIQTLIRIAVELGHLAKENQ